MKNSVLTDLRQRSPCSLKAAALWGGLSLCGFGFFFLFVIHTYSMEQSPAWEADRFVVSQEIPHILLNPKVRYHIHKCPPPVPILRQPNPAQTPTSHCLKIHPNIIVPSTPDSPQWSVSLRLPYQNPIHAFLLPHPRCMPRAYHSSRFYHPHNIGWGVQIMKLRITKFYPLTLEKT
jgi:hypothetical protein